MHFDDRLATVLAQTAAQGPLARIVYRQLVDILGRLPASARSPIVEESFERLEQLSRTLTVSARAQILSEPTMRLRNPRLVATLLESDPGVAAAAVDAARLDEMDWLTLIPKLPIRARGILRLRSDLGPAVEAQLKRLGIADRGLPPAAEVVIEASPSPPPEQTGTQPTTSRFVPIDPQPVTGSIREANENAPPQGDERLDIGDIVRRIEAFRKAREEGGSGPPASRSLHAVPPVDAAGPSLDLEAADEVEAGEHDIEASGPAQGPEPSADTEQAVAHVTAIDFSTDAKGRIDWAELPHAPSLVGLVVSGADADAPVISSPTLAATFEHRQPIRDEAIGILGAPAIAGRWYMSAVPRFHSESGAFAGYAGRLRRPKTDANGDPFDPWTSLADSQEDRMRQILHELRTPANAIQVASEAIQQALFGPLAQEYRAISAGIAGDAALVLAGFDELDRLVKLESGTLVPKCGACDITDIIAATIERLGVWTEPRDSGFGLTGASRALTVKMDCDELESLIWRILASLAGHMAIGEWRGVSCRAHEGAIHVRVALPAALSGSDKDEIFSGVPFNRAAASDDGNHGQPVLAPGAGMFGVGFTLRLAQAEAHIVGGGLERDEAGLDLWLPEAHELVHSRA